MRELRMLLWRLRLGLTNPKRLLERLRSGSTDFVRISAEEIANFCPCPRLILEAGAADGFDTLLLGIQFPRSRILAVEPVPQALEVCRARVVGRQNVIVVEGALSDLSGIAQLHLSISPTGHSTDSSSLLEPSQHFDFFPDTVFEQSISVRTYTIDELTGSLGLEAPDVMWLDMQGMEMRVLIASPVAFAEARVVVTEASRVPLYDGAPTFSQLKRFFREAGFRLGIDRVGAISGNALFYRPDRP